MINFLNSAWGFVSGLNLEVWRTIFSGFTFFAILISFFTFRSVKKKQKDERDMAYDKEILSQIVRTLTWAYEALAVDPETNVPIPSRLNWLTSARHIMRFYDLRDSMRTDTYKIICEEYEEHWRHKFYRLFDNKTVMSGSYYTDSTRPIFPSNITTKSAMILSVFSQWNDEREDPMNSISKDKLIEQNAFQSNIGTGLSSYIEILNEANAFRASTIRDGNNIENEEIL